MDQPPSPYRSYLLRLWLEDIESKTPWRIALINPQTGDRRGFVDFGQLVDFLMKELTDGIQGGSPENEHENTI